MGSHRDAVRRRPGGRPRSRDRPDSSSGAARRGSGGDRRRADQARPDRDERRPAGSPAALGGPCPYRPAVRLERRHRPGGQRVPVIRDPIGGTTGRRNDGAITLGAGGSVDVVDSDRAQVSLEYDLYQCLHFQLDRLRPALEPGPGERRAGRCCRSSGWGRRWASSTTPSGAPAYSREPFVTPFISLYPGELGVSRSCSIATARAPTCSSPLKASATGLPTSRP